MEQILPRQKVQLKKVCQKTRLLKAEMKGDEVRVLEQKSTGALINKPTAVVALSGGVDSSVCCLLLKNQGYRVIGITGKMTKSTDSEVIIKNAKIVADNLKIEHVVLDLSEDFKKNIIEYFNDSYAKGLTPNPCAYCNKHIKWGKIFDYAFKELNANIFATGHYANKQKFDKYYTLFPAKDPRKDQMYFLHSLNQEQFEKTVFPLYEYDKSEIREIAQENNIPSKSQKDSQDICFIKPETLKEYLSKILGERKGDFIHIKTGKKLGEHSGYYQYTIGQRKGIGIAYQEPLYVIKMDAKTNTVYVGEKPEAYGMSLKLKDLTFVYPFEKKSFDIYTKIRYNMDKVKAHVEIGEEIIMTFNEPIYSITQGQIAVFYSLEDGHLIGGGEIVW